MDANQQLRRAVRRIYAWVGSVLFAGLAPFAAIRLIHSPAPAVRIAGVAVAVVAWIPMLIVVARIIRDGDEFVQRMHLVAIAVAFALSLLMIALFDWLDRAEFVEQPPLSVVWLLIAGLWLASLLATKRHFERQS